MRLTDGADKYARSDAGSDPENSDDDENDGTENIAVHNGTAAVIQPGGVEQSGPDSVLRSGDGVDDGDTGVSARRRVQPSVYGWLHKGGDPNRRRLVPERRARSTQGATDQNLHGQSGLEDNSSGGLGRDCGSAETVQVQGGRTSPEAQVLGGSNPPTDAQVSGSERSGLLTGGDRQSLAMNSTSSADDLSGSGSEDVPNGCDQTGEPNGRVDEGALPQVGSDQASSIASERAHGDQGELTEHDQTAGSTSAERVSLPEEAKETYATTTSRSDLKDDFHATLGEKPPQESRVIPPPGATDEAICPSANPASAAAAEASESATSPRPEIGAAQHPLLPASSASTGGKRLDRSSQVIS